MEVSPEKIRMKCPAYPEETPYWPCAFFLHGEEIVSALFFDDSTDDTGYDVDADGVIGEPVEGTGHSVGWTLHVLTQESAHSRDPRRMAPHVTVRGEEATVPEVM